jgi:hypothetical protein
MSYDLEDEANQNFVKGATTDRFDFQMNPDGDGVRMSTP